MGAPFWSNEEKQYFLQQIVPRSHYANGFYESTGRSFEDLATVMQRDLDERNLSRRTYNGDLLFQHWYQKVRPTAHNVAMSSAQAQAQAQTQAQAQAQAQAPAPLPTTSQQVGSTGPQPVNTQASVGADQQASTQTPASDTEEDPNNIEGSRSSTEEPSDQDMAEPSSSDGPSSPQDKSEVNEPISSPLRERSMSDPFTTPSVTNTGMDSSTDAEPSSGAADPTPAVPFTLPAPPPRLPKKRALRDIKGLPTNSKKAKRAPKKTAIRAQARDSDEDDDGGEPAFKNPTTRGGGSNDPGLPIRRLGPALGQDYNSPYLTHPTSMTSDSVLAASRELYNNSTSNPGARSMLNNNSTTMGGYQPQRGGSMTSSGLQRHPLPSSVPTPFTQEDADMARMQQRRQGMGHVAGPFNTGPGYRGPGQSSASVSAPGMAGGPMVGNAAFGNTGMGNAGSASGSVPSGPSGPSGPQMMGGVVVRFDPVTGQRFGEVTLQGPTMMTYCPSCQRPF